MVAELKLSAVTAVLEGQEMLEGQYVEVCLSSQKRWPLAVTPVFWMLEPEWMERRMKSVVSERCVIGAAAARPVRAAAARRVLVFILNGCVDMND